MGITDKLPLLNSKSKIVKIVGYVLYAFVILMIIGAMAPSKDNGMSTTTEEKDNAAAEKNTASSESNDSATADVKESESGALTSDEVKDMLPGNVGDPVKVTVDGNSVDIVLPFKDNAFGMEYVMMGTRDDAVDIFKELFKDNRIKEVSVSSQVPLVDKFGNKNTGTGTTYTMTSETAAKINWDNFDNNNLPDVADDVFIHPAMRT